MKINYICNFFYSATSKFKNHIFHLHYISIDSSVLGNVKNHLPHTCSLNIHSKWFCQNGWQWCQRNNRWLHSYGFMRKVTDGRDGYIVLKKLMLGRRLVNKCWRKLLMCSVDVPKEGNGKNENKTKQKNQITTSSCAQ